MNTTNKTNNDCPLSLTTRTTMVAMSEESRYRTICLKKEIINNVGK